MNLMLWVRQICGFLLLSSLLKYLLSQKQYSSYVRLFLNLLLVLVLIRPILQVSPQNAEAVWQEAAAQIRNGDWRRQLAGMTEQEAGNVQLDRILEGQLEEQLAKQGYLLARLETDWNQSDGSLSAIRLTVKNDPEAILEPVLWRETDDWNRSREAETLAGKLRETLGLSDDISLEITVSGTAWQTDKELREYPLDTRSRKGAMRYEAKAAAFSCF